jgi:tetratricopeptide (TPR) repeat protein
MTTMTSLFRTLAATAFAATLSACATAPVAPPVPKMADLLSQASQAATSGQKEKAVALWQQTAKAYPADKTPWTNIAQTRYDAGQYGEAIVNAQEVLVRDPNDKLANSIIAIAGLRLSTRALGDLSRQNNLTGTLRTESQELAKLLRENLGETVLFPTASPKAVAEVRDRPRPAPKPKAKPSADSDSKSDPFGALK